MLPFALSIVDKLLEADQETDLGDFVSQGLAHTDPFAFLGKLDVVGRDQLRLATHNYEGKHWKVQILVHWNPTNRDFKVGVTLEARTWHRAKEFASYWTVDKEDIDVVQKAVLTLIKAFHWICDNDPVARYGSGGDAAKDHGEAAMAELDRTIGNLGTFQKI